MACRVLRVCGIAASYAKTSNIKSSAAAVTLLKPHIPLAQSLRNTNFYCKRPANQLWKSVTSVSNPGRRRGRAKGIPRVKDLNRGQKLGEGRIPIMYPGLNAPIMRGDYLVKQHKLPENPEREKELQQLQSQSSILKRMKQLALERGWSGGRMGGRKLGPPDPIDEEPFNGFETWILEHKHRSVMTSHFGRTKRYGVIVVTGNGNGLAGFATATGGESKSCLKTAKNKAGQRLMYFERYDGHTVLHDFFTQFGSSKIFVKQKQKGFGLVCHRAIKTICMAIGITDLYAKVEGSTNVPHIIKAFFIGLLQQKTYQQMANEKQLHLVELKQEHDYFPIVVGSPDVVRKREEINPSEIMDYKQYLMGGRIVLEKKKPLPFYTKLPSYAIHLRKVERKRDHHEMRIRLRSEYGDLCSFLTEKYPEARASKWRKRDTPKEEAEEE
ncbi:mitochondrial ribosomal protein S5 [Andrena cerasifolii]|uniref:mitochondrial ribosomal protein S5 n=1 Tax=Andrena cerasifolii TaxID=2819439 RepID=UPI00403822D5